MTKKVQSKTNIPQATSQDGKVYVKVFWLAGIIISIVLSILGTIILNLLI